jgi:hypothetical protein
MTRRSLFCNSDVHSLKDILISITLEYLNFQFRLEKTFMTALINERRDKWEILRGAILLGTIALPYFVKLKN